jgi:ribosomal protein S18 acetylase RimI-like enzyme/predicted nucleic acid-binding protein
MKNERVAQLDIVEVEPSGQLVDSVIALGNGPAKRTLGFLPDQGFIDRARKGTLLAATEGSRLLGYLLYDLPRNEVRIRHLCVATDARRQGVAGRLVDALSERHSDRQRIALSCRYDYEATAAWEALGFRPHASRPGRSKAGHLLTVWVRDFAHPTLFDEIEDNVFLDLHVAPEQRPQGSESRYLLDDWIGEQVELCVTDEVFHEIHHHADPVERAAEQRWASLYRNISRPDDAWMGLVDQVAAAATTAGEADHRHVARAVAGGASYLVTRDGALLRAADRIKAVLGIEVLPPERLVVRLDQLRADDPYRPVALQGTELVQASPSDDMHASVLKSLLNQAVGERRADLGRRLRPMLADRVNYEVQVVQSRAGEIVGGYARTATERELTIPLIRVAPGTPGANVVARQILFLQRHHAADLGLQTAVITDPLPSRDIETALNLEHFVKTERGWVCEIKRGIVKPDDLDSGDLSARPNAIDFEDKYWPVKVADAGIETFMVPIKAVFAEALLDAGLAERSLLPRQQGLGLSREHVYYRKRRNSRGITAGARILWYVTGDSPVHSRGSLRAVSRVEDVVVGRPRSLHARFERFGVYTEEQVSSLDDGTGQVMAIRFSNTEILGNPVDLVDLKAIWAENGANFSAPLSPAPVSEHMFRHLYRRSSAYAD